MSKGFLVIASYFLLVVAYSIFLVHQFAYYDEYALYFFLSLLPHIIGMVLAYRYKAIVAWTAIVIYWGIAALLLFFANLEQYAMFVPTAIAWIFLPDIIGIDGFSLPWYLSPPYISAIVYFIISLLFLFFLRYKRKKLNASAEITEPKV